MRAPIPRETVLFGKEYKRGVTAEEAGCSLFDLYRDHVRADIRDRSLIAIHGEEYVRTTVIYYQKRTLPPIGT
jgi:hypothetical protein